MAFWLHQVAYWYEWCWSVSGVICFVDRRMKDMGLASRIASCFISETKPFYFIFIGLYYVTWSIMGKFHWYTSFGLILDVYAYYLIKGFGDDDHWKRRMEKLREKIEVSEGKLVVVPN